IEQAGKIFAAISAPSKASALSLSADLNWISKIVSELNPAILHLGAHTDILSPTDVAVLKRRFPFLPIMRSIPVVGSESVPFAKSYDGIADFLLLDSHKPGDKVVGALGIIHDWNLDRQIVESVGIPVIMAGGLGTENVVQAIQSVHPAGVDSKTKTDKKDGSHTKDLEEVRKFTEAAKGIRFRRSRPNVVTPMLSFQFPLRCFKSHTSNGMIPSSNMENSKYRRERPPDDFSKET